MKKETRGNPSSMQYVENLFFLSGAAALMYQVCWQRILFFSFGTDIESITIIVSVFMVGLGLGALAGGWAADRWFEKIVPMFAMVELGIGFFGLVSPYLLPWVSDMFIMSGRGTLAFVNFLLLLLPTAMMGATLPMLVTYFMRVYQNVGVSTGTLYCLNTLGAALGCVLTGTVLFRFMPLHGVIMLAACINLLVAVTVWCKLGRGGEARA